MSKFPLGASKLTSLIEDDVSSSCCFCCRCCQYKWGWSAPGLTRPPQISLHWLWETNLTPIWTLCVSDLTFRCHRVNWHMEEIPSIKQSITSFLTSSCLFICLCQSHLDSSLLSPTLCLSLSIFSMSAHLPVCLFTCLSLSHTLGCFSWYFSVIPPNTTLSSCLITKQGHYICLHELLSTCMCVCVWEAHGHPHTPSYPHPLDPATTNYQSL